mgnify:CR=1 FL=1
MERLSLAVLVILAVAACSRPVSWERFVKAEDCHVPGRFDFDLDMADTLVSYDITFYTRLDPGDGAILLSLPLTVSASSPSGKLYSEEVWADVSKPSSSGHFNKDFEIPYRTSVRPVEAGVWRLSVSVLSGTDFVEGFGCVLKRN